MVIGGGRRSSVNFGAKVNRERVRKSSWWIGGVANVDTVCAADLMARSEAVKFDLNVDPRRGNDRVALEDLRAFASDSVRSSMGPC